jgi:hypothetical protein
VRQIGDLLTEIELVRGHRLPPFAACSRSLR